MWDFDIILAADSNWGIGKDNKLPWPMLKPDMAHFKSLTTGSGGNAVVMGRKTWESLPPKFRPLPGRTNVVLTRQTDYQVPEGVIVYNSFQACLNELSANKVFVIGGAEIYREAIDEGLLQHRLGRIHLTRIHQAYDCDTHLYAKIFDSEAVVERADHMSHDPPFEILTIALPHV